MEKLRKMPNDIRPGFKMVSLCLPPSSVCDFRPWFFPSRRGQWRTQLMCAGSDLCSFRRCEGCRVDPVVSLRWIDAVNKARSHSCTHTHSRLTLRWRKVWGKPGLDHTHGKGLGSDFGGCQISTWALLAVSLWCMQCIASASWDLVKWNIYLGYLLFITIIVTFVLTEKL